jgi:hypothetical protein
MKIVFEMCVSDAHSDVISEIAKKQGVDAVYDGSMPIVMAREVDWPSAPKENDRIVVFPWTDPRSVEFVVWDVDGTQTIVLQELDTSEFGEESKVVEDLIELGWIVEVPDTL